MRPTGLLLRDFRAFAGEHRLPLRPLTLVYGPNNAGKSAILRSLPLISDSLSGGLDALRFDGRLAEYDLSFDALHYRGDRTAGDPSFGIGLEWECTDLVQPRMAIEWSIQEESTWNRILVQRLRVSPSFDSKESFLLAERSERMSRHQRTAAAVRYRLPERDDIEVSIGLRGLTPDLSKILEASLAETFSESLSRLASGVLWLRSLRKPPSRYTTWKGGVRWELEPSGIDAPVVLAGEAEIQDEVREWYRTYAQRTLLVEETRPKESRVLIQNPVGVAVDLIDAGEGLGQILPVLTALAMARRHKERGGPIVLAVEEPEAHLHPNLQVGLASQLCSVIEASRPLIIMETHSLPLLLAVQLQLTKGKLRKEDVILYWVCQAEDGCSIAAQIELDDFGRLNGAWPPNAFQDDLTLRADLLDAREEKEAKRGAL